MEESSIQQSMNMDAPECRNVMITYEWYDAELRECQRDMTT